MKLLVIGGDQRNAHLAALLAQTGLKNLTVHSVGLGNAPGASPDLAEIGTFRWIVGPIPFTGDGVSLHMPLGTQPLAIADFLAALAPTATLFSGTIPADFVVPCQHIDLTRNAALYEKNLVPTAEGVLQTLLNHIDFTLAGARVLIAGYGKVGKTVAHLLAALNADVSVFSSDAREQQDIAARYASGGIDALSPYRIVINTIPAPVFTAERLRTLPARALVLDLASFPGGVYPGTAIPPGVCFLRAPGLPGKKAPETVAAAMAEIISEHLAQAI